jgi:hypothetical protein
MSNVILSCEGCQLMVRCMTSDLPLWLRKASLSSKIVGAAVLKIVAPRNSFCICSLHPMHCCIIYGHVTSHTYTFEVTYVITAEDTGHLRDFCHERCAQKGQEAWSGVHSIKSG